MTANDLPAVYKNRQMFEVEQAHDGRDIRLILIDLYNKLGSQAAVARELGVTQQTIDAWFAQLGIQTITRKEAVLSAAAA
jgi:hypothetical protein